MRIPVVDVDALARNWWVVLVRGLMGILFGIATFLAPGISLAALVIVFGALPTVFSRSSARSGGEAPTAGGCCCSRVWWGSRPAS